MKCTIIYTMLNHFPTSKFFIFNLKTPKPLPQIRIYSHYVNFQLNLLEPFKLDTFFTTTQEVSRQIFVVWLDYFCFLVFKCPSTYRIRNSFFIIMIFSFFFTMFAFKLYDRTKNPLLWRRERSQLLVILYPSCDEESYVTLYRV